MGRRGMLAAVPQMVVSALLFSLAVGIGLKLSSPVPDPSEGVPAGGEQGPLLTLRTAEQDATEAVAAKFLAAWSTGRYREMYQMLASSSRRKLSEAQFIKQYRDLLNQGGITAVSAATERFSIRELSRIKPPGVEDVPFTATFESAPMGRFSDRNFLPLVKEKGAWRVLWSPGAIVRDLAPKGSLVPRLADGTPERGRILDRAGEPLAYTERLFIIGMVPGRMNDEHQLLTATSEVLGFSPEEVKAKYDKKPYNWLIPLGEVPAARRDEVSQKLGTVSGLVIDEIVRRVYPRGTLAAPLLGFVGQYNPGYYDEQRLLGNRGYRADDWLGRSGLEQWGESFLAGIRGGTMIVRAPDGGSVRLLAQQPQRPGKDVLLTLDPRVQQAAEDALAGVTGALVVLDIADRSVLAAASSPSFNPNTFSHNPLDQTWRWLLPDARSGLQNRATAPYPVTPLLAGLLVEGGDTDRWLAILRATGGTPGMDDGQSTATRPARTEPQASPLQLASLMAAIAGDGRVRKPLLIRQVAERGGRVEQRFESKDQGGLPVSAEAQQALQVRMYRAAAEEGGALFGLFSGLGRPVAGLAGAGEEAGGPDWFAGYVPSDAPRYALAVVLDALAPDGPRAGQVARTFLERLGP